MTQDPETVAFYNREAETYVKWADDILESEQFTSFAKLLREGGAVMDLGCGGGRAARGFLDMGFEVTAFDASQAMIDLVAKFEGITTICADFSDLDIVEGFDGIWANYCLQHVPRAEFSDVLGRVANALRPNGWLMIGIHAGTETRRDSLGRLYCYHTEGELTEALVSHGIKVHSVVFDEGKGYDGTPNLGMTMVAQKNG